MRPDGVVDGRRGEAVTTAAGPPAASQPIPPPAVARTAAQAAAAGSSSSSTASSQVPVPRASSISASTAMSVGVIASPPADMSERRQGVLEPRVGVGHVGVDAARRVPPSHQLADPALVPEDVGVAGRVVVARDEPGGGRDDQAGRDDRDGRARPRNPVATKRRAPRRAGRRANGHDQRAEGPRRRRRSRSPASGWSITSQAAPARQRTPIPRRSAAGAAPRIAEPATQARPTSAATAASAAASAPRPAVIPAILGWSDARA